MTATPRAHPSRLTTIGDGLVADARRNPGKIQRRQLGKGAQLAALLKDGVMVLTIMRIGAPVGAGEEQTFRRDLPIPVEATRKPAEGQQQHTVDEGEAWVVGYIWADEGPGRE